MNYLNNKIEPEFMDCFIKLPYQNPVVLKAKMINNTPAFEVLIENKEYHIFVDASIGVWKHTLPVFLSDNSKSDLIDAVKLYIFKTRQAHLPKTIFNGCRKTD